MESSSSSSYHSCCSFGPSPNAREHTHDVFLNYRGDTRGFTSHLFAGFERRGIRVYVDYNNLKRGDEISCSLLEAIERSKISIIIFSRNYASSKWSMDELVKIMECKRGRRQIVIPVFYEINPSVVRNQTGGYAVAFARHRRCFKASINQKVQRWRNAMTEAANLAGWDSSQYRTECELVEDIVNEVLRKLENLGDEIEDQREFMSMEPQSQNSFQAPDSHDSGDLAAKFHRLNLKLEDFLATLAHWVVKYQPLIVIKSAVRYVRNNLLWNQIGMKEEREAEGAEERMRLFNYNTTPFSSDTSLAEEARRLAEIERLRELHTLKGRVESFAKLRGLDLHEIHQYYTV